MILPESISLSITGVPRSGRSPVPDGRLPGRETLPPRKPRLAEVAG